METLFLLPSELQTFQTLPARLIEGWQTSDEQQIFIDSALKAEVRLALVRLHDPRLQELCQHAGESGDPAAIGHMIADMDLQHVDDDDLASLCFAMGPDLLSKIIRQMFASASTDKDIEGIAALSVIRHEILASYQPA